MNAAKSKWNAPPTPKEVAEFLERLLDRKVSGGPAPWPTLAGTPPNFVGLYVNPEGGVESAVAIQPALAAAMGGALSLIPLRAPAVQDALKLDKWDPMLVENVAEIANIMLRLAQMAGCPSVTLSSFSRGQPKGVQVAPGIEQGGRAGYRLDIDGYGGGVLGIARAWTA